MSALTNLVQILPQKPRKVARRLLARMQGRQIAHLLHIGKTGGTAIKHALSSQLDLDRWAIFLSGHSVTLKTVPVGEKIFFFTRDPIKRYVSAFFSRQRQGMPRHHLPWTEEEAIAFKEFTTPSQLGEALSAADGPTRSRAEAAMKSIRHIRSSYWGWFGDAAYFASRADDILFVGRQETLTQDFEALKTLLGLPAELSLPTDDVQAHRNPTTVDKKLSDVALANLRQWYERDYEFLELCRKHYRTQPAEATVASP
jgi:hypothetical protein